MKKSLFLVSFFFMSAFCMQPDDVAPAMQKTPEIVLSKIDRSLIRQASAIQFVVVHIPSARDIITQLIAPQETIAKKKKKSKKWGLLKLFTKKKASPDPDAPLLQPILKARSAQAAAQLDNNYLALLPEEIFVQVERFVLGSPWKRMSPKQIIDLFLVPFGQEFIDQYTKNAPVFGQGAIDLTLFCAKFAALNDECYRMIPTFSGYDFDYKMFNIRFDNSSLIAEKNKKRIYTLAEACGYKTGKKRN